jgi:hypothetical protein
MGRRRGAEGQARKGLLVQAPFGVIIEDDLEDLVGSWLHVFDRSANVYASTKPSGAAAP